MTYIAYELLDNELTIPAEWKDAFQNLLKKKKPDNFRQVMWAGMILHIQEYANSPHLVNELIENGWTLTDMFGCHPTHPCNRYDYMGLIMLIGAKTINKVTKDGILLKADSGALQEYTRQLIPLAGQVTLMDLEGSISTPSNALTRSLGDIRKAGLEEYYHYFEERAAIYQYEGGLPPYDGIEHTLDSADWKAMNDTSYKIMEDKSVGQGSLEFNRFLKKILL